MKREEQIEDFAFDYILNLEEAPIGMDELTEIFVAGANFADSHPAWRKCEEEMPEENGEYLLARKYHCGYETIMGYWQDEWLDCMGHSLDNIVAWLPLPKFNPEND